MARERSGHVPSVVGKWFSYPHAFLLSANRPLRGSVVPCGPGEYYFFSERLLDFMVDFYAFGKRLPFSFCSGGFQPSPLGEGALYLVRNYGFLEQLSGSRAYPVERLFREAERFCSLVTRLFGGEVPEATREVAKVELSCLCGEVGLSFSEEGGDGEALAWKPGSLLQAGYSFLFFSLSLGGMPYPSICQHLPCQRLFFSSPSKRRRYCGELCREAASREKGRRRYVLLKGRVEPGKV